MRVALVTHFFPPDTTPGAVRPRALADALHQLGHDVTVVTANPAPDEAPYSVVSVLYTRLGGHVKHAVGLAEAANLGEITNEKSAHLGAVTRWASRTLEATLQHPDKYRGWIRAMRSWAETDPGKAIRPDVVIATSPPISTAVAGADLTDIWRVPLLLELRDLWTENPYYRFGPLRKAMDTRAERRLLRRGRAIVVATAAYRDYLLERFPGLDVKVIRTGVPEPAFRQAQVESGGPLRIGHFGSLEDWCRRDPVPVAKAAARLASEGRLSADAVRFDFFGPIGDKLQRELSEDGLDELVALHGLLPRSRASEELARTDVGLLLMWREDRQSMPMKASEYLAARKPVIVWDAAQDSEVRQVLGDTDGVWFCDSQEDVTEALLELLAARRAGLLGSYAEERARPFLARTMAEAYEKVLLEVSTGAPPARVVLIGQARWTRVVAKGLHEHTELRATALPIDSVGDAVRLIRPRAFRGADLVVRIGFRPAARTIRGRAFDLALRGAMRLGGVRRVAFWWLGTDAQRALDEANHDRGRARFRRAVGQATHIADSEALGMKLRNLGVEAKIVWLPAPNAPREAVTAPLPDRFTVLVYVPDTRPDFYDGPTIVEVARLLPDIEFRIVGGNGAWLATQLPNLSFLGWQDDMRPNYERSSVLVRLVEDDSVSCMVVEALASSRAVIYSEPFPYAEHVAYRDVNALQAALVALRDSYYGGTPAPDTEGARWARSLADEARCYGEIARILKEAAES